MSRPTALDLCACLEAAGEPDAIRAALVDALAVGWGAEAVVAWLPRPGDSDVRADDVSVGGALLKGSSDPDLLAAIAGGRLEAWLVDQGLGATAAAALPAAHPGQLAAGWRNAGSRPELAEDLLQLLVAQVALAAERRCLAERLAESTAARLDAEEQIARTRRVRAVGELASGIVHDFNNSLTTILGFTELALGRLDEEDASSRDLANIRAAALDAAALVRRLQALTRRGGENERREIADLREIVRTIPAVARLRWRQPSELLGIRLDIVVDDGPVPPVSVAVAEIRELLLNLLFNAVDAMPSGGRITIATATDPAGWATVSVADEGIGMTEEVRRHMFRPFFTTKGDRGSGLGLSVCETIARRHGGVFAVDSVPGLGTTVTLRIPPAAAADQPIAVPPRPSRAAAVSPRRILLVDDQADVRESVAGMLRSLGHRVSAVDGGPAALALAGRSRFDVVVTDVGMPGMNGLEVAERLRALVPAVPVILLSGWDLDAEVIPPSNVARVLSKPVTLASLNAALADCPEEQLEARSA